VSNASNSQIKVRRKAGHSTFSWAGGHRKGSLGHNWGLRYISKDRNGNPGLHPARSQSIAEIHALLTKPLEKTDYAAILADNLKRRPGTQKENMRR
jgi:hypothetical protein